MSPLHENTVWCGSCNCWHVSDGTRIEGPPRTPEPDTSEEQATALAAWKKARRRALNRLSAERRRAAKELAARKAKNLAKKSKAAATRAARGGRPTPKQLARSQRHAERLHAIVNAYFDNEGDDKKAAAQLDLTLVQIRQMLMVATKRGIVHYIPGRIIAPKWERVS